jgi:hypothetical protein
VVHVQKEADPIDIRASDYLDLQLYQNKYAGNCVLVGHFARSGAVAHRQEAGPFWLSDPNLELLL